MVCVNMYSSKRNLIKVNFGLGCCRLWSNSGMYGLKSGLCLGSHARGVQPGDESVLF